MLDQRIQSATDAVKTALADTVPPPIEELVGSEDHTVARPAIGWRGPLVAIGTAIAVLVVVGVAVLALRGDGVRVTDTPTPTTTTTITTTTTVPTTSADVVSTPAEVFNTRTDSFCEWFTAQEMNEIVAVAQQRAGTAYVLEEFTPGGCDTFWRTPRWWAASRSRTSVQGSTVGSTVAVQIESVNGRPEGMYDSYRVNPDAFVEHHLLDDGVSYQNRTYQFLWQDGLDGYLKVDGHADEILYFGFSVDDTPGATDMTSEYEELGLAVINELLRRMNWIGDNT